jgi:CTP-dependent riboflavin kinase
VPAYNLQMAPQDLSGTVQPGRGLARDLMADARLPEWFAQLAGFSIVPGTLNVRLLRALERGPNWRYVAATEISSDWEERTAQVGYFLAGVLIQRRYRGLAFQAQERGEPGYPANQVELMSEVHLRSALDLTDGDLIRLSLVPVLYSR